METISTFVFVNMKENRQNESDETEEGLGNFGNAFRNEGEANWIVCPKEDRAEDVIHVGEIGSIEAIVKGVGRRITIAAWETEAIIVGWLIRDEETYGLHFFVPASV